MDDGELWRYRALLGHGVSRQAVRSSLARGERARPSRGVYGDVGVEDLRGLFARLPTGSVLGFHSAGVRYGLPVPPHDRVHVIVPPDSDVSNIRGVAAHASVLPVRDPVWLAGVPCVPPQRCAVDLARRLRRQDALPLLDVVLRNGLCTLEQMAGEVAGHVGLRGVRQARELIGWADPRAECLQESQLRLILLDARLPSPVPQIWVGSRYRIDLGYPKDRVGIEYDGSSHVSAARMQEDRYRHNWLSTVGWRMRYFTARDLYKTPTQIPHTIRPLLRPTGTPAILD